jgi:hypothetical protein
MNKLLSVLAGELVLANVCEFLIHNGCLLPLRIKYRSALCYLTKTTDDSRVNKTNRFVDV